MMRPLIGLVLATLSPLAEAECLRSDGTKISTHSESVCHKFGGSWVPLGVSVTSIEDVQRPHSTQHLFVIAGNSMTPCGTAPFRDQQALLRNSETRLAMDCEGLTDRDGVIMIRCNGTDGGSTSVIAAPTARQCTSIRTNMAKIAGVP